MSLPLWNLTPDPTPTTSPTSSVIFDLHEKAMDQRPLSLSIPTGAFSSVRPTLDDVLANAAPYPYTLGAFMAYLSQNHCLETLEFTMEAKRYGETYRSVARMLNQDPIATECPQSQHLRTIWHRLLAAYISPGAPREINLSSEVRDALLAEADGPQPPLPETLDAAVRRMHDLMEESIFIHFVNSQSSSLNMAMSIDSPSLEDAPDALRRVTTRGRRGSPESSRDDLGPHRVPGSARIAALAKTSSHISGNISAHSSSVSGDSASPILTDDSVSVLSSPVVGEPMTPPNTPPSSDLSPQAYSPKNRSDNTWKKMGMRLGFKKRPGGSTSRDARFEE